MHTPRKLVSTLTVLATVLSVFSPLTASPVYADSAASVPFLDTFPVNGADVLGWDTEEFSRVTDGSVRIGCEVDASDAPAATCNDGFGSITRTIDATGFESLVLSYDWRANAGADPSDFGLVQYCAGEGCSDFVDLVAGGHPLDDVSWGGNSVTPPASADDSIFRIRFTVSTNQENERFWVDNVEVTGDAIPEPIPGCMDPAATNFNPLATEDDSSCTYPPVCDEGYHLEGEACVPDEEEPPVCDEGYHLEGDECVPDQEEPPVCDEGYEWNGEACVPVVESTPTPTPEPPRGGGGDGTPSRSTLIVKKVIVFGEDASVSFSDFSFMVEGQDRDYERTFEFEEDGSNELSIYSGEYSITEEPGPGYTTGYEGDCAPDGHVEMLNGETYTCIIVNTLGVGGFNPGSDIPAPTPSPTPIPSGSPTSGGSIQEDDFESATEVDVTGERDVPASSSDSDEEALEAAIGNQGEWPWWIPWLILFLLILWWFWRRRSGS